jgi:hypothetical protein
MKYRRSSRSPSLASLTRLCSRRAGRSPLELLEARRLFCIDHLLTPAQRAALGPDYVSDYELSQQEVARWAGRESEREAGWQRVEPAPLPGGLEAAPGPETVGEWSPLFDLGKVAIHTSVLPNGNLLTWDYGGAAALFNTTTNALTPAAPAGFNIFCAGTNWTEDGKLLVTGGNISYFEGLPHATTYDPATGTWTPLADMREARWYPTNVTLEDGSTLITAGSVTPTVDNVIPEVLNRGRTSYRNLTGAERYLTFYPQMFLLPNGEVFQSGSDSQTRSITTAGNGAWSDWSLDALSGVWRDYGTAVMYRPGKVMWLGGGIDPALAQTELVDFTQPNPQWTPGPTMTAPRRHFYATSLPDGNVFINGGVNGVGFNDTSTAVLTTEMFNPATGQFTIMDPMDSGRWYHSSSVLLPDGRIFTGGGDGSTTAQYYSPPYLFRGARPQITAAPAGAALGSTFSLSVTQASDISRVTMVRLPSVTHSVEFDQRFLELPFTRSGSTLSVQAPADGNLCPPGPYMVFALNSQGVPSVAKIVRFDEGPQVAPGSFEFEVAPRRVSFTFSQDVAGSVDASDMSIVGPGGVTYAATASTYDAATHTAQFSLPANLPDGNYTATLAAGAVSRLGISNAASGQQSFFVLAGDANRDRKVNFDDLLVLASNYNKSGKTFSQGDFSYDGTVNFDDLLILAAGYNSSLQAAAPLGLVAPGPAGGVGPAAGPIRDDDTPPRGLSDVLE